MQESQFVVELQREATLQAKIEDLKEFLEGRFGELPADLLRRIEAVTDLSRVKELIRSAGRVKLLEEFSV